ncbi:MAG: PEP-CTERM sorting domain-containing protein [Pirellulales bacterium]|nr:PEP-CTERM sorting domain-containing protein [Planctomycetales bacterium]
MTSLTISRRILLMMTCGLLAVACAARAEATVMTYRLHDHPDGNQSPPAYGLRLDNIFLADDPSYGGSTTFSFDHVNSTVLAVVDDVANTLRIFGTAHGGTDVGSSYGTEVEIFIDFSYTNLDLSSFNPSSPDLMVPQGCGEGTVTVTSEINNAAGLLDNVYHLESRANDTGNMFNFKDTTHRGYTGINGWGWVRVDGTTGTQDWLFTSSTMLAPEPTSCALLAVGALALVVRQRRR